MALLEADWIQRMWGHFMGRPWEGRVYYYHCTTIIETCITTSPQFTLLLSTLLSSCKLICHFINYFSLIERHAATLLEKPLHVGSELPRLDDLLRRIGPSEKPLVAPPTNWVPKSSAPRDKEETTPRSALVYIVVCANCYFKLLLFQIVVISSNIFLSNCNHCSRTFMFDDSWCSSVIQCINMNLIATTYFYSNFTPSDCSNSMDAWNDASDAYPGSTVQRGKVACRSWAEEDPGMRLQCREP